VPEQQINLLEQVCKFFVLPQVQSRFFVACYRRRKRT
jgi:hypothetical protein